MTKNLLFYGLRSLLEVVDLVDCGASTREAKENHNIRNAFIYSPHPDPCIKMAFGAQL
jgi:hypothetical protein